ncbi:MAG: hypothetical protein M0036_21150 [Desulfobacteraceae bacterium]|nr:hypothetical protein [Desulfobacteraceae bacterium]
MRPTFALLRSISILLLLCAAAGPALAQDLGGSVLRDYPVALTLPKGRWEFSLDYLAVGEVSENMADAKGLRLLIDYGLQSRTTLMSSFAYQDLDFESDKLTVLSADLLLHRNLIQNSEGWKPKLAISAGARFNTTSGGDSLTMDTMAGGISERTTVSDLQDITPYARLTAGEIWGWLFPNLFLEYGYSDIRAKAESSSAGSSQDLSRNENYIEVGLNLLIKFPYKALLHLEYDYLHFYRGDALDQVDDNQIIKADFSFHFTPSLALTLGACYQTHALNGQIPFLYQQFSQESFKQDYRGVQVGVTILFGGN